ncbi:MAG: ribose-phosphate diphosphokinase [Parvibaculum sp.]|nr:ribose-phosphate diphosphokinase [Parvibaculum sp.]
MIPVAIHSFEHGESHACELASRLGLDAHLIDVHTFPDGESRVGISGAARTSLVYCPLDRPNTRLVDLMLAVDALRRAGAQRLVLVAPYLCYMRQDKAFHEGEAVSQQAVACFLSSLFDRVVTVDAHLHRVSSLAEVFPGIEAENLIAADTIARFAAERGIGEDALIAGPDEEAAQWVGRLATALGASAITGQKVRHGDREVEIVFPDVDLEGKSVLIADDIVSSGGTVLLAVAAMKARGAISVRVAITHALFGNDVYERMLDAGADAVWSTTSVPHPTNAISLAGLLGEALQNELGE